MRIKAVLEGRGFRPSFSVSDELFFESSPVDTIVIRRKPGVNRLADEVIKLLVTNREFLGPRSLLGLVTVAQSATDFVGLGELNQDI